jgi:uncharacterized SAM-dependent methyltransferase
MLAASSISSAKSTSLFVDERKFHFRRGEKIITEFSYNTRRKSLPRRQQAGFEFVRMWTDDARLFGVFYFERSEYTA